MKTPLRIGIVAGEISGDILGGDLIHHLKKQFPNAIYEGIGGIRMQAEGFHSFFPLERLAVMGLFEPLKRLPEILHIRRSLIRHFLQHPPDVFIGIDAPDFNLSLEKRLKKAGIKTVHYVSPTVWAWRQSRIHTIKKAIDVMLTLFPFETAIYQKHHIPVTCVGHPLADQIPLVSDKKAARKALGLVEKGLYVAIMPGSRLQELKYLGPTFLETAKQLHKRFPDLRFISAQPNQERYNQFEQMVKTHYSDCPIQITLGNATTVMTAADAILIASGTACLEAMLIKRPTAVAYKMSPISFWIANKLIKVPYIALPNLLANKIIMPEFIQNDATPEKLSAELSRMLDVGYDTSEIAEVYTEIHQQLRKNAGMTGSLAIVELLGK